MKQSRYIKLGFGLLAILTIAGTSCKKILTQEPRNSTYNEVYWQSSRDARTAIAGNYALVRDAFTDYNNRYYMYGDAIAKNYFTIQYTGDGLEGIQNGDFTFQYNINSLGNWTKYYKAIAMSNIVIKRMADVTDDKLGDVDDPAVFRNSIIGQAYFLRALCYFAMVRVWGDVPLVTEAYDDPINAPRLARSPKADIMKQIEDDCHKSAELTRWGYTDASEIAVIANRGAAYALLAHLYLWRATMLDVTTDVPNAADVASADTTLSALITQGGYSLTDTSNYYSTFIGGSSEGIFEFAMSENTLEGSNSGIGMSFLRENLIPYFGTNPRNYVAAGYFDNHFWYGHDVRFDKNFDYVGTDHPVVRKYSNVVFRNPGQKLNAYLSNNMNIFRLSDMMLLQAEVKLYKNDENGAADIINFFRKRNGASDDALIPPNYGLENVTYEYVHERGAELYLEGHIFYDLLRTRMYKYIIDWLPDDEVRFKKEGFYWPVDPRLFRDNQFLKQTPYWVGKV